MGGYEERRGLKSQEFRSCIIRILVTQQTLVCLRLLYGYFELVTKSAPLKTAGRFFDDFYLSFFFYFKITQFILTFYYYYYYYYYN